MMKKRILGLLLSVVLFTSSVGVGYAAENEENAGYNQEEINWNLDGFQEVETKITQLEESELPEELMAEEIGKPPTRTRRCEICAERPLSRLTATALPEGEPGNMLFLRST